ncbi:MAG: phosphatase PAP2 family protein [Faecalibacterium sp.]|jgi:membrane-associated phospholipid phosphatase|nr:phosphatase PAP2 family protein [Faecalibacterium sp.]
MTTQRYQKIYAWFMAHPAAKTLLLAADTAVPLLLAVLYGILLGRYGLQWYRAANFAGAAATAAARGMFWRIVLIPAATLAGGTLLRNTLNCPRPYAQPGFLPLKTKEGDGCSLPSRHALSAGVIASVWVLTMPGTSFLALVMMACVCVLRVLVGVHSIRDVVLGALLGFGCGLLILLP